METSTVYKGYIGIMEKECKMETSIVYVGLYGDNGTENENYYSILGLYGDNGKENGSYYGFRV